MRSVSEKIDERILRLLGLEDVFDLDYDTYLTLLKEAIVTGSNKLPQEELALLANERKRVRGKKGRFKPKKDKITAGKVATTKFLKPAKKTLALPPSQTNVEQGGVGGFVGIRKTLDSILSTLGSKFKFDQKQADQDRKEKETEKRGKREASLEGFKKGVAGIVATTKKMLDPFQAIIDRIWKFIFFTLLGRAFTKFMEWMSDKGNQEKFNSFIEFLTDHWPALAGLYVLFGTSFGKLVRGLLKGATRMIVALAMNIPKIFAFIRKNKKLAFLALAAAPLVSREIGNLFTDKETPESGLIPTKNPELDQAKQSADQAANTKVPTLNFGGMIPSFKMGGMDFSGGVPITGAGQDDTLIAAKTGEAILTEKDQVDLSQRYVDRNTGQPLNVPQYLAGRKPGSVNMGNLRFPGFGGGFFSGGMIPKFNNGGVIGSGILPGTGTVMAPKTMGNTTVAGYQNKFLGIPLGKVNYPRDVSGYGTGYSQQQMQRYERYNPNKQFKNLGGVFPALVNRAKDNIVGDAFRNFGTNVKTIKGAAKRQEEMMRQMGYEPSGYTNLLGQPIRRQGGGLIETSSKIPGLPNELGGGGGGTDALTEQAKVKTFGSAIKGFLFGESKDIRDPQRYNGGGIIKENTGMNIRGATADRQLTALQPGEYVLPVDTVNRLGTSLIDKLVAMTDSNSNPYLGRGTVRRPQITPYNSFGSNGGGMMTLPPITQSAGGSKARSAGLGGGSEVPEFSATAPGNERAINASIYGLVG